MPPEVHFDPSGLVFDPPLADRAAIREVNPQRFDMEQLDAVVYVDQERGLIVGYKDVRSDEFWVAGHMPGYPIMPGVLICEASAQLCSYYTTKKGVMPCDYIGFGGLENVRFRGQVRPGDRLVLVAKMTKLHRRQMIYNVQGFVGGTMVFHGDIIGVALNRKEDG